MIDFAPEMYYNKREVTGMKNDNIKANLIIHAAVLLFCGCSDITAENQSPVQQVIFPKTSTASEETVLSETTAVTESAAPIAVQTEEMPSGSVMIESISASEITQTEQTVSVTETAAPDVTAENMLTEETDSGYYLPVRYDALNYDIQHAVWISYLEYSRIMKDRTEEEFTNELGDILDRSAELGINTIYMQVRAFGDAYYNSSLFPKGDRLTGDYDPLGIAVDAAHDRGMAIHAWINPMRMMTEDIAERLPEDTSLGRLYAGYKNGEGGMFSSGDRLYLDPSDEDAVELICGGVREIISGYNVDGIQIDDYFYPETSELLDRKAYISSGTSLPLDDWRRENVNNMVLKLNAAVHEENDSLLFGISPSGNITSNYSELYADTEKWCRSTDYCDYICPQIYYGFMHDASPFENSVRKWLDLTSDSGVKTVIGLSAYKIGTYDKYAGSGSDEWIERHDILARQIMFCEENGCGTALFRADSLFYPESSVRADVEEEIGNIISAVS